MKSYVAFAGFWDAGTVLVEETGQKGRVLNARLEIRNHSPTGFAWGYGGSGPAQLALAICCDALGDVEKAQRVYQEFKRGVIERLDGNSGFRIEADAVVGLCTSIDRSLACRHCGAHHPAGCCAQDGHGG
jgi:hypothetical protein